MSKITKEDIKSYNDSVKAMSLHPNGCIVRRNNHRLTFGQVTPDAFILRCELYDKELNDKEVEDWRREVIKFNKGKAEVSVLLSKGGALALYHALNIYLDSIITD